ncbi:unnamed protein product [Phytophthora fragariaefolia]|uniref:Unnamed protein product n=1 Tax=Phytophthora fragariaefolia TaxID=1490495 RepID=A0A9W6XR96_9STRA|nr:unnamed protein product [Phytophthora fragariaefolia]
MRLRGMMQLVLEVWLASGAAGNVSYACGARQSVVCRRVLTHQEGIAPCFRTDYRHIRLVQAGLTLKLKKCRFTATSMEYLGHQLSSEGVRPLDRLVSAVQEFPRPKDAVEAKRFVHLAGYYRRFVEGFGSLTAPITKLLRKDVEWEWTPSQEFALEYVKKVLTSKPLLVYQSF